MESALSDFDLPVGHAEVRALCDLYDGGLLEQVMADSSRDLENKGCDPDAPQILYIRWQTLRRMGRISEAQRTEDEFLARFPRQVLGANMLWAQAAPLLAAGDFAGAGRQLSLLLEHYPDSSLAPGVRRIRDQLN